jgi:hypothetical protein
MSMQSALASMLMQPPSGGGGAPPMAPPNSLGVGPPPTLPGTPPAPEMVGQMPLGSTANNAKQAADVAISALRDAKGYYPSMGDAIDGIISQFQSAGQQAANAPAPQVGVPGGPGAAMPTVSPTGSSGSPGAI